MSFKYDTDLQTRKTQAKSMLNRFPDRIPVILEAYDSKTAKRIIGMKVKFLIPHDITVGHFLHLIRKRIGDTINEKEALFLFFNNKLYTINTLIAEIYKDQKDEDLFLYCTYGLEETFGGIVYSGFKRAKI